MQPHNRSYFQRPETPNPYAPSRQQQHSHSPVLSNLPSYNLNKSYGRLPAQQQQQGYGSVGQRANMSRSKVSMASSHVS
jgi:hypothetical protein